MNLCFSAGYVWIPGDKFHLFVITRQEQSSYSNKVTSGPAAILSPYVTTGRSSGNLSTEERDNPDDQFKNM